MSKISNKILGVRIDKLNMKEVLKKAQTFLNSNAQHAIFTPNPEMLVEAHQDEAFRNVLNLSSVNICDGTGISLLTFGRFPRVHGSDFAEKLCELAEKENKTVYLLGSGSKETLRASKSYLLNKFTKVRVVGMHQGPDIVLSKQGSKHIYNIPSDQNEDVIADIVMTQPDILLVGFGHIKQEKWITAFLKELPSVKIAVGIGGTFDFWAGNVNRAPKFMRMIGLEWLWRLFREPKRIKRIMKAVVVFPILYAKSLLKK